MRVKFDSCTVREVRSGTSKNGNDYCVVRIISQEPEMYELFFAGSGCDLAKQLSKGQTYDFDFELVPAFNGGVRLDFAGPAVPSSEF